MPRVVEVDAWGVTWEEYKELTYFCLQYEQKKRDAAALLTIRVSTPVPEKYYTERTITLASGKETKVKVLHGVYMPHGSGQTSDPVAATAAKRDRLLKDVRMIEQAAHIAVMDTKIADRHLIKAVTKRGGVQAVYANPNDRPTVGERQFHEIRRKFFWILREMRSGDIEPIM